jgi:hypothetical protein
MAITAITRSGLAAIGFAVLLLWTCILVERATVRRALAGERMAVRELRLLRLKKSFEPAAHPVRLPARPRTKPVVG